MSINLPHRRALLGGAAPFSISDLFANGTYAGFDFTDLDVTKVWGPGGLGLLKTTTAGDVDVASSGDAAGLALDKSQGLVLGAELITNGDFTSASGWTQAGSNLSVTGGKAVAVSATVSVDILSTSAAMVAGIWYLLAFDISGSSSNDIRFGNQGLGNIYVLSSGTNGHFTALYKAPATGTRTFQITGTGTFQVDNVSFKAVAGNHALQATSGQRPTWQANSGKPYLNFDGVDDNLATLLVPATAGMTLAACLRPASTASLMRAISAQGSGRCGLSVDGSGLPAGQWGTVLETTIKGGASITGTDAVTLLRANASVVELWCNGTLVYSGASSGAPDTSFGLWIGAGNNSGSSSQVYTGRIYRAAAVQRFIPDSMVLPLMRALGAGIVSF